MHGVWPFSPRMPRLQKPWQHYLAIQEDVIAEIACLSQIGDLPAAGKAASAFSRNPFVLAQLALALSDSKPRQALAACHAAVESLAHPDGSIRPELTPGEIILQKE